MANYKNLFICNHCDVDQTSVEERIYFEYDGLNEKQMNDLKEESQTNNRELMFQFHLERTIEDIQRGVLLVALSKTIKVGNTEYELCQHVSTNKSRFMQLIEGKLNLDVVIMLCPMNIPKDGEHTVLFQKSLLMFDFFDIKNVVIGIVGNQNQVQEYNLTINAILDMFLQLNIHNIKPRFILLNGETGHNITRGSTERTLYNILEQIENGPNEEDDTNFEKPFRFSVNGVYKIKGTGDVICGKIMQGELSMTNQVDVAFYPDDDSKIRRTCTVKSLEMKHKIINHIKCGDSVGIVITNVDKDRKPKVGDIMVLTNDTSINFYKQFKCTVRVMNTPYLDVKVGSEFLGLIGSHRCNLKILNIHWKTNDPNRFKEFDTAEILFESDHNIILERHKDCNDLGRIGIMAGLTVFMFGKFDA